MLLLFLLMMMMIIREEVLVLSLALLIHRYLNKNKIITKIHVKIKRGIKTKKNEIKLKIIKKIKIAQIFLRFIKG